MKWVWSWQVFFLTAVGLASAPTNNPMVAKVDRHGDPLPLGALARFGSVRFRGEVARAPDGKSLATLRCNRAVVIDADTGAERKVLPGPDPADLEVWHLVVSPDGRFVAYGGPPVIEIWSVAEGKRIGRYVSGDDDEVSISDHGTRPVAFSPDGKSLLIQIVDRKSRVGCWDVAAGELRWQTDAINPVDHASRAIGFTNMGQHAVVMRQKDKDCRLVLMRTDNGELEHSFELGQAGGHGDVICRLAPNGEEFAFLEQNDKLRRLELPTGRVKPALTNGHGDGDISAIAYSVDGKKIALIDFFSVRICDTTNGQELGRTNNSTVIGFGNSRCEFSDDGKSLWVVHQEERAWQRFDGANGRAKKMPELGHRKAVSSLALSPNGKFMATSCEDEVTRIWDAATCQPMRRAYSQAFGLFGGDDNAGTKALVFHPDGKNLIGAALDNRVVFWNPETGQSRRSIRVPGEGSLSHLALSRDGSMIAVAQTLNDGVQQDALIRLYNYADGKEIRKIPGVSGDNTTLSFSPDGRLLAAANSAGEGSASIVISEVASGRIFRAIAASAYSTQFTNHGHALIYATPEGITVWELASGSPRLKIESPPKDSIDLIAVSPDGRTLAGANKGAGTRRIYRWDLRTGEMLLPLIGHDHYITALQYAYDGRLISGSQDTTALIWEARKDSATGIVPPTNDAEFDSLWIELSRNAADAHKAMERMIAAGDDAIPFIANRIQPAKVKDNRMIERWAEGLDASRFVDRQRAIAELEALDTQAYSILKRVAELGHSAEARRSAGRLLDRLDAPVHSAEIVRSLRTIEVLQRIGTPKAVAQIEQLSKGDPSARMTQAAITALRFPVPALADKAK